MPQYDAEQLHIIRQIKRTGARRYGQGTPKYKRYVRAALEIGSVESHFHNLAGGDADSQGWRQERASIYKDPRNLHASINRVFDEMESHDHGQHPWELAADVQRPAAQYRTRYHDVRGEAKSLMRGDVGGASIRGGIGSVRPGTAPKLVPGQTKTDDSAALVDALLDHSHGGSLLKRYSALVSTGAYTTTTAPQVKPGKGAKYLPGEKVTGRAGKGYGVNEDVTKAKGVEHFDGKPVTAWIAPILAYAREHGWKGTINSGVRSYADQQRIWNSGVRPAAKPGTSNHEMTAFPGGAIDVSDAAQLSAILKKSRYANVLVWAGAKDPVHFSHPHNGSY